MRRVAAVLTALLLVAACSDGGDDDPAAGSPPEEEATTTAAADEDEDDVPEVALPAGVPVVEVLDAGEEPRELLRFEPREGDKQQLTMRQEQEQTIDPETLKIPERVLALLPPPAPGFGGGTLEFFEKRTAPVFDPLSAAGIAADLAVSALLQHERAARLVTFHARQAENPGFGDVVNALVKKAWTRPADAYAQQIARTVQWVVVSRLMDLAAQAEALPQVRATATNALRDIMQTIGTGNDAMKDEIDRFLKRPDPTNKKTDPLATPPGDPIGGR